MVDVITICGRWNGHLMNADYMADVVAIGGRWSSHFCQMQPIWQRKPGLKLVKACLPTQNIFHF